MFTLWRKLELAESVYFRPLASYSSSSLSTINRIDVAKKDAVAAGREQDTLEMTFKSATSPLQILSTLPSAPLEYRSMAGETVIRALQSIAVLQRTNKNTIECGFITSHPNFEQLCHRLKRCSPMFTPNELVNSFKFLCSLGIPTNSEISLVLLNLIRHEINNLEVNQIIYLDYVLSQTECRSELQKSIQHSLPLVFDLQVQQQIDKGNSVDDLIRILNYLASHKHIDSENKNMTTICRLLCDKSEELKSGHAISIIYHLCAIDQFHLPNSIRLMAISLRRLVDQFGEVDIVDVQKLVSRLIATTVNQFSPFQFHLHGLLKCYAERIALDDLGLDAAVSLQKTIKNISFQSSKLLMYIGDKLISDVNMCRSMSPISVFTVIQAFANNVYVPEDAENIWSERILPALLANEGLAKIQTNNYAWLQFTLQLAVLGHFDEKLISRVLSPLYLDNYLKRKDLTILDLYKILILYQTVAMRPDIDVSFVDRKIISDICKRYIEQVPVCHIKDDLIDYMGKQCVLTDVRTKYMHIIHTLVKFNKETQQLVTFPRTLIRDQDGFIRLTDIPCGQNEVLICMDPLKRHHLFSNITARKIIELTEDSKIGIFRLRPKQLEQLGLTVCEIHFRRYKTLPVNIKAKYLRDCIAQSAQTSNQLK